MTPLSEVARILVAGGASAEVVAEVLAAMEAQRETKPPVGSVVTLTNAEAPGFWSNTTLVRPDVPRGQQPTFRQILQANRGLTTTLAERLGITPQAISMWDEVPAERVIEVCRITGLSPYAIRPDMYPIDFFFPAPAA